MTNGIIGFMSAIDLTNNTMKWQFVGQANGLGRCYSGSLATAGNLVFTWFKGRLGPGATCPNQGTTQQGAADAPDPGRAARRLRRDHGQDRLGLGHPERHGDLPDGHVHVQGEAVPRDLPRRGDRGPARCDADRASATS